MDSSQCNWTHTVFDSLSKPKIEQIFCENISDFIVFNYYMSKLKLKNYGAQTETSNYIDYSTLLCWTWKGTTINTGLWESKFNIFQVKYTLYTQEGECTSLGAGWSGS